MAKHRSSLNKLEVVLKGLAQSGSKKGFCQKQGISCSTYDRWKKDLLTRLFLVMC